MKTHAMQKHLICICAWIKARLKEEPKFLRTWTQTPELPIIER